MVRNTQAGKVIKDMPVTTMDLDMTNNCILACDYCFRGEKNKRRLSWEVGKRAIDWLIEESGNRKKLMVALFGGEPLMEFKLIKKLVPYAKRQAALRDKNIHFSATTNCVLINDEMIQFFRQYGMSFHTSIDGGPESQDKHRHFPDGSGTSKIIEPIVKKILKHWPTRTARMSVSNDTVHRWMDDVLYLVNLGYKNLAMILIPELDWTEEQWGLMRRELRKISDYFIDRYRQGDPIYIKHIDNALKGIANPSRRKAHCGAGRGYVLVKTDGTLYPCHRFGGDIDAESEKKWQLGSIYDGWDREKRKVLLNYDCTSDVEADCENCLAVHMCGVSCIAVNWSCFQNIYKPHPNYCKANNMYFVEAMRVHYILESEKNKLFIKKYHPERQRSRPKTSNRRNGRNSGQRDAKRRRPRHSNIPTMMLVMLSSESTVPCFRFGIDTKTPSVRLSPDTLADVLLECAQDGNGAIPAPFFLADSKEPLDQPVALLLEDMSDQIITPLLDPDQQSSLHIPFSQEQTVVANSLQELVEKKDYIRDRVVILHLGRTEIPCLAEQLFSISQWIRKITFRLNGVLLLQDEDVRMYKEQLEHLSGIGQVKGVEIDRPFDITNLDEISLSSGYLTRCPAGSQFFVLAPDALVYPCPAFYYAGRKHSLGSIDDIKKRGTTSNRQQKDCAICGCTDCLSCPFLEEQHHSSRDMVCKVYKAEKFVRDALARHKKV